MVEITNNYKVAVQQKFTLMLALVLDTMVVAMDHIMKNIQ